jgi:hypothetical protein
LRRPEALGVNPGVSVHGSVRRLNGEGKPRQFENSESEFSCVDLPMIRGRVFEKFYIGASCLIMRRMAARSMKTPEGFRRGFELSERPVRGGVAIQRDHPRSSMLLRLPWKRTA